MNEQRFVVSDALWQRLEPHLPGKISDGPVRPMRTSLSSPATSIF